MPIATLFTSIWRQPASHFVLGIFPQALPEVVAYTLYRWEVHTREAVILGYIGAGGIGQQIQIAISLLLEHRLLTLLIAIYPIVTVVDHLNASLRTRLI